MARRKRKGTTARRRKGSRAGKKVDIQTIAMVILGGAAGYVASSYLAGRKELQDLLGKDGPKFAPIAAGAGVALAAGFLLPDRMLGLAAAAGAAAPLAAGVAKITGQAWFPGPTGTALAGFTPDYSEIEIPLRGPDMERALNAMRSIGVTNAQRMLSGAPETDPLRGNPETDPLAGDMPLSSTQRRAPSMQRVA